ncbi:ABC transporter substrate-binding protein [Phycicoccus sonneratiae]|uniref:ABC transporter substrate-binding protein n=1 Tax=Phycicoccus sonneratiae TaxID=2807628 RepID=A0ABS2CLT8_9MICO|nr:ABC transporter substrate-binding protein [Phycicoccus sonneraticus]MBM6400850.1 ABC transporter substrate-binding protein [Phycicoccus sonneraticus]
MARRDRRTPDATPETPTRRSQRRRSRRRPVRLLVVVGVVLAALVAGGVVLVRQRSSEPNPETLPSSAVGDRVDTRGGRLNALSLGPVSAWDPQRIAARADMAFAGRVFARTLTAYAPSTDPRAQSRVVGDLATDAGTPSKDLKTWTFVLRDGVQWQDGSPVTCEDVAYGISRTFATKEVTGGPTDALAVLAVPRNADGTSTYAGPYATGAAAEKGQAAFDKAVACDDRTITFTLSTPTGDFAEMLAQPAFGPVKKSVDRRADGTYDVFSAGPYMLRGTWEQGRGGTFVRNPHWSAASDPVRKAYPDEIHYQEGLDTQAVAQQVMADNATGRVSVSLGSAPPAIQQHITAVESLRERSVNPLTGVVDYLVPNTRSEVFKDEKVRLALAAATNRDAYVTAIGGGTAADPAVSLLPRAVPAAHDDDPVAAGTRGDAAKARALLEEAGVTTPVTFTVAYRSDPTADKAMAALVAGWRQAGFDPQTKPVTEDYFSTIADPRTAEGVDVFWSNWAPAWASGSTVLPPLFDSAINITASGPGRDYGYFADKELDEQMAKTSSVADHEARERGWADVDRRLLQQGAYIGLAERRALYVAGSDVRNLSANGVLGGVVEFADIAVVP